MMKTIETFFYLTLAVIIGIYFWGELNTKSAYLSEIDWNGVSCQEVRVFKVKGDMAKIAPYHSNKYVVYTKNNEERWVKLNNLVFNK